MPWLSSSTAAKQPDPSSYMPTHVHRRAPDLPRTPRSLKVVLIGDGGAGKTSLRQRYLTGAFSRSYRATIGADFVTKTVSLHQPSSHHHHRHHHAEGGRHAKNKAKANKQEAQQRVTLAVWDTAGQERFRSLGSAFYRGADAAIIAYDVTSPGSLARTVQWVRDFCEKGGLGDPDELLGISSSSSSAATSASGSNFTATTARPRNGGAKKRPMDEADKEAARRFCWIAVGCKSDLLEQLGGGVPGATASAVVGKETPSSAPAASKAKGALEWKRRFAEARRHFDAIIPRDEEDGMGPSPMPLDETEEEEGYNIIDGAPESTSTTTTTRAPPSTDVPAKPEDVLARPSGDRPLVVGHGTEAERPPGAGPRPGTAPKPGQPSTDAMLKQAASVPVPGAQGKGTAEHPSLAPTRRAQGKHAATERIGAEKKKRSSIKSIDVFQPPAPDVLDPDEVRRSRTRSVGRRTSRPNVGDFNAPARRTSLSTSSNSRHARSNEGGGGLSKKASFTSSIYRPPVLSSSPGSTMAGGSGSSPYYHSHGHGALQPRERYDSTLSSTSMGGNSVYHTPRNSTLFGSSLRSGETLTRDAAGTEAILGSTSSAEELSTDEGSEEGTDREASLDVGKAEVEIEGGKGRDGGEGEEEVEVPVKRRSMISSSSRNSGMTMRAWRDSRGESERGTFFTERVEEEQDGAKGKSNGSGGGEFKKEKEAPIPFPTSSAEAGAQAPQGPILPSIRNDDDGERNESTTCSTQTQTQTQTPMEFVDDDVSPEEAARQEAAMEVGDAVRLIDAGVEETRPVLEGCGGGVVQEEVGLMGEQELEAEEEGLVEGVEVGIFGSEAEAKGKGKDKGDAREGLGAGIINRDEALWRGRDAPQGLGKRIVTALWRGEEKGEEEASGAKVKEEGDEDEEEHKREELSATTDTLRRPPSAAMGGGSGGGREAKWRDSLLTADPSSCGSTIRGASPGPEGRGRGGDGGGGGGNDDEGWDEDTSDGHASDDCSTLDEIETPHALATPTKQVGKRSDSPPRVPSGFTLLLCSAKTGEGVEEVFNAVVERVSKRWEREEWEEKRWRAASLDPSRKGIARGRGAGKGGEVAAGGLEAQAQGRKGWGWGRNLNGGPTILDQPDAEQLRRGIQIASGKAQGGWLGGCCA